MLKKASAILLGLVFFIALTAGSAMAGDVEAGAKYYKKKCKSCHGRLLKGGKHGIGPSLWGIFGRQAGRSEGFRKYSAGLIAADFTWDAENLDKWLMRPKDFIPKARMVVKVKKEKDRANIIAYLKTAK